jgi:hypothetical protein
MNDEFTITPAPVATAGQRDGRAQLARIGLLGIASAALIAAAILLFGATASPAGTLAGTDGTNGGANGTIETLHGFGDGRGGPGFGHGPGREITITAISGSSISLETVDGWTRTIEVDDATTYTRGDDDIALADLAVGDEIAFRQTLADEGSWRIDAIAVILPHAGGEVTAVDGSTVTVEQRDGTTTTITVADDADVNVNGDDATAADIEVGMVLVAQGTENADGSLTASMVKAFDPDAFHGNGRHGFKFGPGFDRDRGATEPDATQAPTSDTSAS